MCGLTGFMGGRWASDAEGTRARLRAMADAIHHRGPDHSGSWLDAEQQIALGHKRLAIIDLSPAGEQPMRSTSGRYVIVYNGEIYNHLDIRAELADSGREFAWRGHSDTETFLAAIETWGVVSALERVVGMFAFALWDRRDRQLILARDRVGEKPLYYGWQGRGADAAFLFGSELKSFSYHPAFEREIDRGALALFMRHNYIPAPHSIYRGISKLRPGCYATLSLDAREPVIRPYWSGAAVAQAGIAAPIESSPEHAV